MIQRLFAAPRPSVSSLEFLEPRIAPATVTSQFDNVPGSLRQVILASAAGDTIDFDPSLSGQPIVLTGGQIFIDHALTIVGLGPDEITISGNGSSRIFTVGDSRAPLAVSISGVTLTDGHATTNGGAIQILDASVSLSDVAITGSSATDRGGAISIVSATGTLDIVDSTISGNTAGDDGGGIYASAKSLTIDRSTIADNSAGKVDNTTAAGGIFVDFVAVDDSSFSLKSSTISGNSAYAVGGLELLASPTSQFLIANSTIADNSASVSGGVFIDGASTPGATRIYNSTIAGNKGLSGDMGGVYVAGGTVDIVSSILADNLDGGLGLDLVREDVGTVGFAQNSTVSVQYSLVENPGDNSINGTFTNSKIGQDPALGALGNYGGPTPTKAIADNSVALDGGSNPLAFASDQRGEGFDRTVGFGTDMGAFEVQAVDLAIVKTGDANSYGAGATVKYSFAISNGSETTATGVKITDPLPTGLTFDGSENPGWTNNSGVLSYAYGTLNAQASDTLHLTLHLPSTVPAGLETLSNTGTISDDGAHGADAQSSDNTSTATATVAAAPVFHLSITDDITKSVAHGGKIIYQVSYSNTGDQDAQNVTIRDFLGSFTSFNGNASDAGWHFNADSGYYEDTLPSVPAGSSGTIQFAVIVDSSISTGVHTVNTSMDIFEGKSVQPSGFAAQAVHDASDDTLVYQGIYVISPGVARPTQYAPAVLQIVDLATAELISVNAYDAKVRDSVRTAVADFNGDGFDDVMVVTEHGRGAVKVFDGTNGHLMDSPFSGLKPFGAKTGAFVALGDLNGNPPSLLPVFGSSAEAVFGSSLGGGAVKIYDGDTGAQIGATFYPFGKGYKGGVRVAIGDVDNDGRNDLIVAQGNFGSTVKVYRSGDPTDLLASFNVGKPSYKGGLNLTVGDLDHDGGVEIVTGRNRLSAPTVEVFHYQPTKVIGGGSQSIVSLGSFDAFAPSFKQGVRVALADVDLDGNLDFITSVGYAGRSQVAIYGGEGFGSPRFAAGAVQPRPIDAFVAYPRNLLPGVWVAATSVVPSVLLGVWQPV